MAWRLVINGAGYQMFCCFFVYNIFVCSSNTTRKLCVFQISPMWSLITTNKVSQIAVQIVHS